MHRMRSWQISIDLETRRVHALCRRSVLFHDRRNAPGLLPEVRGRDLLPAISHDLHRMQQGQVHSRPRPERLHAVRRQPRHCQVRSGHGHDDVL